MPTEMAIWTTRSFPVCSSKESSHLSNKSNKIHIYKRRRVEKPNLPHLGAITPRLCSRYSRISWRLGGLEAWLDCKDCSKWWMMMGQWHYLCRNLEKHARISKLESVMKMFLFYSSYSIEMVMEPSNTMNSLAQFVLQWLKQELKSLKKLSKSFLEVLQMLKLMT